MKKSFSITLILILNLNFYSNSQESELKNDTTFLNKIDLISNKIQTTYPSTKKNINIEKLNEKNLGQDIPSLLKYEPSMIFNSDAGNGIGYSH